MTVEMEQSVAQKLEHACQQLEVPGSWRVFLLIDGTAADAQEIADLWPWASSQRAQTMTRVFRFQRGLAIVTGGTLSDDEGRLVFDTHEALEDKATAALIVPPTNASPKLIKRMYARGLVPTFPTDPLPNARGYWALCAFFVFGTLYAVRFVSRASRSSGAAMATTLPFLVMVLAGLVGAAGFAMLAWRTRNRFIAAMSDPVRVAHCSWGLSAPPPPRGNR